MRKLGYTANRGSSGQSLKKYLIENNISTEHFVGKAHGTSKGNVGYLMANTEEDLINILKVFAIHGFYEQESKKS